MNNNLQILQLFIGICQEDRIIPTFMQIFGRGGCWRVVKAPSEVRM